MDYLPKDLEKLLEYHPEDLVEIANAREDLKKSILEILLKSEYFELAYKIDPEKTESLFITQYPLDAFIYGVQNCEALREKALKYISEYSGLDELSEEIYEAYLQIGDDGKFLELLDNIGDRHVEIPHFGGELYQAALEKKDYCTLRIIAYAMVDTNPFEAWVLAKELGIVELEGQLEVKLGIPEIHQYQGLLTTAHNLMNQVSQHFGIKLPNKVVPGGPEGSYASIKYNKFGDVQHVFGIKSSA